MQAAEHSCPIEINDFVFLLYALIVTDVSCSHGQRFVNVIPRMRNKSACVQLANGSQALNQFYSI